MRLIKLDNALELLQKQGHRMVTSMAAAEPQLLFSRFHEVMTQRRDPLRVYCANPGRRYPCFTEEFHSSQTEFVVMFLTESVRSDHGPTVQYLPQHLSQWFAGIQRSGEPIDIFWGSCSLADERGFVSLGPSNCYESEAFRNARLKILEVNPNIPMTYGSTIVPVVEVDYFVESSAPLPTVARPRMDGTDLKIADYVADLVPHGSTLQLGIGSIPNAIGKALENKRDLGVHTEMMNDTMLELYEKGVITGRHKTRWPRKMIAAFAYGTDELYRFINRNPLVEFHPASVVNDPYRIGLNHLMISINSAVEVDLTGQVCSESLGHKELSGVGGASDTHVGAQRSVGGRGIVVIKSTTQKADHSKIVFELNPGAKVSISRNDVDTIVTEYGVAMLKGKTVSERVRQMIGIAHPNYREGLLFAAKNAKYL
ncbi:MAG TPA: acetyl-CoA hydrolase/transferase C-terminal domain-containing protein [Oligoflexus sp.]|uniref:acetyl-CoA hydrolase/transferase family protein n=1 Tax=Oligoflexus sp. TaxID=1971216 RepID=UPI002D519E98|nr:acetyl-CoA hydrolase/transferase C-terminal domain-containing protein [Oligoflexus sp.]HYX31749.1 acetyl-CoA hydrolase/transferase C-terminal domain-containing protein [Oligoflexus sp.]